ncbi:NSFL1 cofactor p47 [Adelges cooleyi]|uniref:NSFL1 cofactor p47 n=1 Tax=Adelges cooleyi TaxID=133065 RepID=UPI0021802989|nr:NSFL1 cofactor p47 [Adelges cooleyi]
MSESEQTNKINEFTGITNVDQERAKFYLELAAWNLDSALASFYDEGTDDEPISDTAAPVVPRPAAPATSHSPMMTSTSFKSASKPKKWQPKSRIMTFSSMKNSEVDDKDSDDDEGQRFYAGGSITSGQQVIGPPRNNTDAMTEMFQAAQKYASSSAPSDAGSSHQEGGSSTFFGTGYKLGQTETDTEVIPSHSSTSKKTARQSQEEVVLKMWKEGFTINDGELHSIEQQENREFLLLVARGEVPPLLLKEANVTSEEELHVSIEDHRFEEYAPPKQKKKLFGGSGHLLGSPAPEVVENVSSKDTLPSDNGIANESAARAEVPLQEGAPTTSLQIRLADGSRLVASFNQSHTIGDVRRYLITARSSFAARPFILQSSYPPKTLDNNEQTLLDAGLLNTVIFQRLG